MERIKEAVEIAKANRSRLEYAARLASKSRGSLDAEQARAQADFQPGGVRLISLDQRHLNAKRIIAHDVKDERSRSFEMLRSQVFRKMSEPRHQTIGITSPTAGCGKTVCALNLAFSIAGLPERSITLVDLDLRKPQIKGYLGLPPGPGLDNVLRGEATLEDIAVFPDFAAGRFRILATSRSSGDAAVQMASRQMEELVQVLRAQDPAGIVLFDLPPVLVADDVISFLPHLDCILLVVAAGQTTISEITGAERLLGDTDVIGIVLNKSEEGGEASYYY